MERIAAPGFRGLTGGIDTTTPAARMTQTVGSFAEFERAMVRKRTAAGLAAARAEGRTDGRRPKPNATQRREAAESVVTERNTGAEMARLHRVDRPTVSRIAARHQSLAART